MKSHDEACAKTPLATDIAAAAEAPTVYSERYRPQFHYTTKKSSIVPENLTTGLTLRVNDDPVETEGLMVRKLNPAWREGGNGK